jgi:AraC-like DNA-binding protein
MPGFLQMGRMIKYALPAIILILLYGVALLWGGRWLELHSLQDILANLFTFDVLLRFAFLILAAYYVLNILLLPRLLARKANVPGYMFGYSFALSVVSLLYIYITISFSHRGLVLYVILFTLINMYLTFRTLETMAMNLPKPVLETVEEEPTAEEVEKAEHEDFNEANLQRFHRVEYWMQNHRDAWTDSSFGRDRLCLEVGYNRHLLLQCLRSQGYNNIHDYISRYRVEELKRLIQRGQVQSANEAADAGFGTSKTARSCFQRMEGTSLDAYLERHNK